MRPITLSLVLLFTLACGRKPEAAPPQASAPTETPLPDFTPCRPALEGTLVSVGSDSMDPLIQLWVEDLKAAHPGLKAQVLSRGSGTAPKALLAGQTRLGHMSREMTRDEVAAFQAAFGYPPTRIVVAIDALAIYVNANNPVKQLSLEQVDALFSTTRKGGYTQEILTWGDLGLGQEWSRRAVMGISGVGKTTLLNCIAGLDHWDAGRIRVGETPVPLRNPEAGSLFRRRHVGLAFQQPHLLPEFTVLENVLLPFRIADDLDAEAEARGRDLLARVGVSDLADRLPGTLSGGQAARIGLVRAVVRRPSLWLLDEPTGNLDPATAEEVFQALLDLHRELRPTTLIVTHNPILAAHCERTVRLGPT